MILKKKQKLKFFSKWKMRFLLFLSTFKTKKERQERGVIYDE
jgi:hypothetical protein